MTVPLQKQLEERVIASDREFGRRRHPFLPLAPGLPRDSRMRKFIFKKLGLPNEIEARVAAKTAFAQGDGSYAVLLVCRTSAVIEQCMFGGVPGIRDSLIDLAAFALIWADCVEVLSRPTSPKHGAPR